MRLNSLRQALFIKNCKYIDSNIQKHGTINYNFNYTSHNSPSSNAFIHKKEDDATRKPNAGPSMSSMFKSKGHSTRGFKR